MTCMPALAQSPAGTAAWPNRALRFVVPFPAAGGADLAARVLGQAVSDALRQPVVIENRPGANGNIGAEAVARGPADGYTFTVGSSANITTNPLLMKLDWDPLTDLVPVAMLSVNPMLLFVNPTLVPVNTLPELITFAKAKKGDLDYASGGDGSPAHMATELLMMQGGFRMVPIQYKGGTPGVQDVVGGRVGVMFAAAPTVMPHARAGRLRLIATTSARRSMAAPEVPTIAESGFPDFDVFIWNMLLAPAQTPPAVIQRLNAEINRLAVTPEVRETLGRQGAEPMPLDPAALKTLVRADYERWAKVVKVAGLRTP
jgi:tripartite-type tricarboxylate transporter receptor subunit TctC